MQKTKNNLQRLFDSQLETSQQVLHDLSGQLHVISFCIDEVQEILGDQGGVLIEKMSQSIDKFDHIVKNYREVLRGTKFSSASISIQDAHNMAWELLDIYSYTLDSTLLLEVDIDKKSESSLEFCACFRELLFSLYSKILIKLRESDIKGAKLKVECSNNSKFSIDLCGMIIDENFLREEVDSIGSGSKVSRVNLGTSLFNDEDFVKSTYIKNKDGLKIELAW